MTERRRILVIDDESDVLDTVRIGLELAGFTVLATPDGAQGLRVADAEKPDLVLLDLQMPTLNGIEVCRRLKEGGETKTTPVIILSAHADESSRLSARKVGADDYVLKPFDMRELVDLIHTFLR